MPEGRRVSYLCTVGNDGLASTVWQGSAFTCPSSVSSTNNRITLPHSAYSMPLGAVGTCGDLSAISVNFTAGVEYTSRLTFTATAALNGTIIECTISSLVDVGSDIIKVGGK